MNPPDRDPNQPLAPDDVAFLRRVADAYAPPPMTAVQRARFDARLGDRIAPDRWRFLPWVAAATAASAAGLLLMSQLSPSPVPDPNPRMAASVATPARELVRAVVFEPDADFESSLPRDYQAIASLLGGDL